MFLYVDHLQRRHTPTIVYEYRSYGPQPYAEQTQLNALPCQLQLVRHQASSDVP